MRRLAAALSLAVSIGSPAAVEAWSVSGTRISMDATQDQFYGTAVSDGAGGAFVLATDSTVATEAWLQRVDASGLTYWGPVGATILVATGTMTPCAPVPDGAGGAYVIYKARDGSGTTHVYVSLVTSAGTLGWGGTPIDLLAPGHVLSAIPSAVPDGSGGLLVFWTESFLGTSSSVRGQRVNAAGVGLWAAGGVVVGGTGSAFPPGRIQAVSDGSGGAVLFWDDQRAGSGSLDTYAQRVNGSGVLQWLPATGIAVCTAPGVQQLRSEEVPYVTTAVNDGAGGFVVAWCDRRSGDFDVYAQKLDASGVPQWAANGVPLATGSGDQHSPHVAADGTGGTVVAWMDDALGLANQRIGVQHLDAAGTATWGAGGMRPSTSNTFQANPDVVGDGVGGAFVVWQESRVRAQHISGGLRLLGDPGWGVAPSSATQQLPCLAADGSGGAIVSWSDSRDGAHVDLYTQRIYAAGRPGVTATASLVSAPASSPALVPLEHTARLDVVFSDASGQIEAYRPDGSLVTGFPIATGYVPSAGPVAVGDCEGDGHFELFAGTATGKVAGYRDDATGLPGWPISLGTGQPAFVAIGPLGADGSPRIVVLSGNRIDAFHADGTSVGGLFPVTLPGVPAPTITVPPAIGDLTGDGVREIVAAAGGTLYVYNASGLFEFSFSLPAGETISDAPTLADVDLDGQLEIAVPTSGGRLFLLNANGSLRPGYPITETPNIPLTSVAFANVAGTSDIELAYAEEKQHAHLRSKEGAEFLSWPESSVAAADFDAAPVIGSTRGGPGDVVIGADDGFGYAWTNIAGSVTGWPYNIGDRCLVSPAVGDMDQDGLTDVVFLTRSQMVIMTTFGSFTGFLPADPHTRWPMAGYDPERTGCLACSGLPEALGVGPQAHASAMLLAPPSPNPVRGATTLRFELPQAGRARIAVFDAAGREVARPIDGELAAGPHVATWDTIGQPPGVYLVRFETMSASMTRRVAVIR